MNLTDSLAMTQTGIGFLGKPIIAVLYELAWPLRHLAEVRQFLWRVCAMARMVELWVHQHGTAVEAVDSPSIQYAIRSAYPSMPSYLLEDWSKRVPMLPAPTLYHRLRVYIYRYGLVSLWHCRRRKASPQQAGIDDFVSDQLFDWWSRGSRTARVG